MSLGSIKHKIFKRNRRSKKYKIQRNELKEETRLKRLKKIIMKKLNLKGERRESVGLLSYNNNSKLWPDDNPFAIPTSSAWKENPQNVSDQALQEPQATVDVLRSKLHEKNGECTELRNLLHSYEDKDAKQRETLHAQTMKMEEMNHTICQLQDKVDQFDQTYTQKIHEVLSQHEITNTSLQSRVEELMKQNSSLVNELVTIKETSRKILNVYVSDSSGVAIGPNNCINITNEDNETVMGMSEEVKRNLESISLRMADLVGTCQQTNHHLTHQTDLVKRIDDSVTKLSKHPVAEYMAVASELHNIRSLVQQICSGQDSANADSSEPVSSSLDSIESNAAGEFAMWTLQDDKHNVLTKLELLPKMYPLIETMYNWMKPHQ